VNQDHGIINKVRFWFKDTNGNIYNTDDIDTLGTEPTKGTFTIEVRQTADVYKGQNPGKRVVFARIYVGDITYTCTTGCSN
jgi:hypothetical protein